MEGCIKSARQMITDASTEEFNELIEKSKLTDIEKDILTLKYCRGFGLQQISDDIGISDSTCNQRHVKILRKIARVL